MTSCFYRRGDRLHKCRGSGVITRVWFQSPTATVARVYCILFLFRLMASSVSLLEKDASQSTPVVVSSYFNPISPFFNAYDRFARWRAYLGLPQPGTVENLQKEVKGNSFSFALHSVLKSRPCSVTHLSNYVFDGARADLTKSLSMNPLFQVTHSFALGSQTLPSSYNFGAIFANTRVMCSPHHIYQTVDKTRRSSSKAQWTMKVVLMRDSITVGTPAM